MDRSNKIPAMFPRRDMKTDEIVWPVDIYHLQATKVSQEKKHKNNDTLNQYRQSHSPVCSSQLVKSKRVTRRKLHLNLRSYNNILSQVKPKKRNVNSCDLLILLHVIILMQ